MTLIVDASCVVAGLVDDGPDGRWAESVLASTQLAAPHFMPVEVANILRRAARAGDISDDTASLAHSDLLALDIELFPYEPLAPRVWQLRTNLTAHDAWYVALAEALSAPLATLDRKLAGAPTVRCTFRVPSKRTSRR